MSNRTYEDREIRLVTEWVSQVYPRERVVFRYRIVTPPPYVPAGWTADQATQLLKPTGFMVDAVVLKVNESVIIEAKTDNESQAIGQLKFYKYLIETYPTLQDFSVGLVHPVMLFARVNPDLQKFALQEGVDVSVYSPDWIQSFLKNGYTGGPS